MTMRHPGTGPYGVDDVEPGGDFELSDGHLVHCAPAGGRGGSRNLAGGGVLATDPKVESAGVDVGFAQGKKNLRAPDVAVGRVADAPGWSPGAPPLAVEYADTGQNEASLRSKIVELLAAGTKHIWVVRLADGEPYVEVHEPGKGKRKVGIDGTLRAPGILQNDVPVRALVDREAAFDATLRNLLQRRGYESVDAILAEGEARGRAEGDATARAAVLLDILATRAIPVDSRAERKIRAAQDTATLDGWIRRALTARTTSDLFGTRSARRR